MRRGSEDGVYDCVIVGGGIVGLATAYRLTEAQPGVSVAVVEKEPAPARHQTGRNSGVLHSGIYYQPGSLKAVMCRTGRDSMVAFAQAHDIAHDVCGKLIVATDDSELPGLHRLHQRGTENGLNVELMVPAQAAEYEPHVNCVAALRVPSTGIIDYVAVTETLARILSDRGVELRLGTEVVDLASDGHGERVVTTDGELTTRFLVTCAGQYSDRLARLGGLDPEVQIVPFRGEYFELRPEKHHLVRSLIYPVPDPAFPFLGVHLTTMIGGGVHAGPNAVLALGREGYRWRDVNPAELAETLRYPGFWKLAAEHWRSGLDEMMRSWSRQRFARSLQRLVSDIEADDLIPAPAGIRAQALRPDGGLVDDFLLIEDTRSLHVANAPSPAATASLEIGRHIADRAIDGLRRVGAVDN